MKKPKPTPIFDRTCELGPRSPIAAYLGGLRGESRRVQGAALRSVADVLSGGKVDAERLAWHELGHKEVVALRSALGVYAPLTANRYLTATRMVLRAAWRLGLIDRDAMERAADVAKLPGQRPPRGRAVGAAEVALVFEACRRDDRKALGARDLAVVALLYGTGLRRAEVARLELEDLDRETGALRLVGKGNKARTAYLARKTLVAVEPWLRARGSAPGPLIAHVSQKDEVVLRRVSDHTIYNAIGRRHIEAGVRNFTPHDLRRTHIGDLLDAGVDIATIARQVGHASVSTTARYDRRDERAQAAALLKLDGFPSVVEDRPDRQEQPEDDDPAPRQPEQVAPDEEP